MANSSENAIKALLPLLHLFSTGDKLFIIENAYLALLKL